MKNQKKIDGGAVLPERRPFPILGERPPHRGAHPAMKRNPLDEKRDHKLVTGYFLAGGGGGGSARGMGIPSTMMRVALCLAVLDGCGAGHQASLDDGSLPGSLYGVRGAGLAGRRGKRYDPVAISSLGFCGGASGHLVPDGMMRLRGGGKSSRLAKAVSEDEGESQESDEEDEMEEEGSFEAGAGSGDGGDAEGGASISRVDEKGPDPPTDDEEGSLMSQGDSLDDTRVINKMREACGMDSENSDVELSGPVESARDVEGEGREGGREKGTAGVGSDDIDDEEDEEESEGEEDDEPSSGAEGGADVLGGSSTGDGLSDSLDDITYDPLHIRMMLPNQPPN